VRAAKIDSAAGQLCLLAGLFSKKFHIFFLKKKETGVIENRKRGGKRRMSWFTNAVNAVAEKVVNNLTWSGYTLSIRFFFLPPNQ
jgi:hypothetical protein